MIFGPCQNERKEAPERTKSNWPRSVTTTMQA